ncbi:MAG: DUF4832 domain-containing protein [Clostridiales bacterium]|nr:DUF4832 domain-containing protein [Clostridiales bacterium]
MIDFRSAALEYDRIYTAQPLKGVCLFGGEFEPDDYSMVYCGAYFDQLYHIDPNKEGRGTLQVERIEQMLDNIAKEGRTVVFRPVAFDNSLHMDSELVKLLEEDGDLYANGDRKYPNWDNPRLIAYYLDFIKQFGKAYDGDPRIACVQIGLYGAYGEWNYCGVRREHHAYVTMSHEAQVKLVRQYCRYFQKTKIQARNPEMGDTVHAPVGFHDDNFVFNSADYHTPVWDRMMDECTALDGEREGGWYELHDFETSLRRGNLYDRWQTQMMGAEISGVMGFKNAKGEFIYGNMYEGESLQALLFNTTHFHMTFSLGFQRGGGGVPQRGTKQYDNFRYAASVFGYDFMLKEVSLQGQTLDLSLKNYGAAPLYYDWDCELLLTDKDGKPVKSIVKQTNISQLLPMQRMNFSFDLSEINVPAGEYDVLFRIINPLMGENNKGFPLIMSNKIRKDEYAVAGTLILS